jgi:hypothetical protein
MGTLPMLVCDSPNRPKGLCFLCLSLLSLALCPITLCAEFPEVDSPKTESLWSEDFPQIETRVYWGWPEFLTPRWHGFLQPDDPLSVSLLPVKPSFGKLFGEIDWLSPGGKPEAVIVASDPFVIRAKNGGLGSGLFPDWVTPSDYQVTLVRGGTPQLFGARGRFRAEYGDEFDDVKRIRGQVLMNLIANHIGIDASVNSWEDQRPLPKGLGDFWTGDANVVYSMGAQRVAMRGGLGASWVYANDLDLGYNFTYGADLFLTRPWLLTGEVDWGKISNEKLLHWRATFGVQLWLFEAYVGYDSYKWENIRFDGPVVGAGIWF